MFEFISLLLTSIESYIGQYIDIDYSLWLSWLLTPLFVTFFLPFVIFFMFYMNAVILYIYKLHRDRLRHAYETHIWDGAIKTIAAFWDAHGWLWHGYDVSGLENIPDNSPALFVYYHGAIPIDLYYFIAKTYLYKNRLIHTVADRFLFKIPGFKIVSEVLKVIPGTVQTCSGILKEDNLLAISPGGVFEAQFGDSYYRLMWKKRLGFAKVALEAKVPVIPVFTQNLREAFRSVSFGHRIWQKLYSFTRLPIVPIYGGFPVKLRTHVGKPIPYSGDLTPEQLQMKVLKALDELIHKHQRLPGSILRALLERFYVVPKGSDDEEDEREDDSGENKEDEKKDDKQNEEAEKKDDTQNEKEEKGGPEIDHKSRKDDEKPEEEKDQEREDKNDKKCK